MAREGKSSDEGGSGGSLRALAKGYLCRILLLVSVVVFGCGNNISKQIAAKPMANYSYMMSLATAASYVVVYSCILCMLRKWTHVVSDAQMKYVWSCCGKAAVLVAIASLGDALGDGIGMICTPYVTGPVHSLTSNCTPIFITLLSFCILRKSYTAYQCIGLGGVALAVLIGVKPKFDSKKAEGSTDAFFAFWLGGSCIFNALSFVVKEYIFREYASWKEKSLDELGPDADAGDSLNIFVLNSFNSLFQLPMTVLLIPMNEAFGQTHGKPILTYTTEAFACMINSGPGSCGPDADGASAGEWVATYVVMNICWNISILFTVKHSGALSTFLALKTVFPVSSLLFAYVEWPLLGRTSVHALTWISIFVLLPSLCVFEYFSQRQAQMHQGCCYPFFGSGNRSMERGDTSEEPLVDDTDEMHSDRRAVSEAGNKELA